MQHDEEERNASHIGITITGLVPSTAFVICPFPEGQIRLPQLMEFQDHIIEYIFTDPTHSRDWKARLPSSVQAWEVTFKNLHMVHLKCKPLKFPIWTNHHLKLLKPVQELHRYTEQILRLYTGFGTHPAF